MVWAAAREAVDLVALGRGEFDDVADRLPALDDEERQEAVLRVTALSHEMRHFHDFLLTPYGNQLVRDAFWYSILTFGALTELSTQQSGGERLKVPLPVDPSSLPIYGKRLIDMRAVFNQRATQGLGLMEAAAVHVQIHQATIDLGPPAGEALSAALRRMGGHYRESLGSLWWLQDQLGIDDEDFAPIALALVLNCLLDPTPMAVEELTGPLREQARGLPGTGAAGLILTAVQAAVERVAARAFEAAQQANAMFLDTVDRAVPEPEPLRELVRDAFADFADGAAVVQSRCLEDPAMLLDPRRYLREGVAELVQPFVYLLSDGVTTMQVRDRSWEAKLSDPLTYVREYEAGGQTVFELVCVPAPKPEHALDEEAWKNFADAVAGSLVIVEGADRGHPVEGMWMRKMEDRWPIDFTPFGTPAAWASAPVRAGAVV